MPPAVREVYRLPGSDGALQEIHLNTWMLAPGEDLYPPHLLPDPVVVLQQPLQGRPVGVELGLAVWSCQEPPLAAIQGLGKARPEISILA